MKVSISRTRLVILLLAIIGLASCMYSPKEVHLEGKPAHHTTKGFRNVHIEDPNKSFFSFLRMRMFGGVKWADHEATADQVPYQKLDVWKINHPPEDQMQVSWLGHSTFLIQYQGINILTDPVFSDRASPVSWSGPKRYTDHVVDYSRLPRIDLVVISHNHYDHLDVKGVQVSRLRTTTFGGRKINYSPKFLVPLGLGDWLVGEGIPVDNVQELDWWDTAQKPPFDGLVSVQALPSQHWSARGLFDRRETLWASWRIDIADKSIWFAGDTGYNPVGFKEIGERAGPVDLALIPIGAYDPRSFMKTYHVDPDEAVMIHKDVKARKSIGMHWGTYPLTAEEPMDPPRRLKLAREKQGISEEEFGVLALGQTIILPE
jgi:N-acyl-phosphatidylethanolamine-hydrolysing phospholipase D